MEHPNLQDRIWSMTTRQLAEQCRALAEAQSALLEKAVREEARRLYEAWRDALDSPGDSYDDRARKASLQAGLRKRTIEILVKVSQRMGGA